MKKDQAQDKYKEITQDLKEEKMTWDFEDFLDKTKKEEKIIPLAPKTKGGTFPKTFWMAASVILLISIGLFFNYETESTGKEKDNVVINEIVKDSPDQNTNIAINLVSDTLKIDPVKVRSDSTSAVDQKEVDIIEQIIPKRGRINRNARQRYAEVSVPKKLKEKEKIETSDYESSYVIINGQKIENEQEAIDLTKYSFRILSENVSKTVAQTEVLNSFTNDY